MERSWIAKPASSYWTLRSLRSLQGRAKYSPGALLDALNAGRPGMAAIDVFDEEPISWANDPLATHPNLIGTPHIGFVTEDEFEIQFADIFDQVVSWRDGAPINMINPEAAAS